MIFRRRKPLPPPLPPSSRSTPRPAATPSAPGLHPAQLRPIDWEEEDAARQPLAVRKPTYVPSASEILQVPSVHMASPDANVTANVTPFATIEGKTLGSHSDRARAWTRYAMPLCAGVAIVATIMAWTLAKVPVLSFWSLLIFGLSFVVSYTVLLLNYWRHTPEGVALDSSRWLGRFLRDEQKHRHQIERQAWEDQRRIAEERRRGRGS